MGDPKDKRINELLGEIEVLRFDNEHQSDIITALKCQVNQKDKEINRLHHLVKEGRQLANFCSQCKLKDNKIMNLTEDLEAATTKQHEAMNRALHLAERNQLLERELKDIDSMALEVEEECQNKVKQNLKNMDILQDKLQHKIIEIKNLQRTINEMKCKIESDNRELELLKTEKRILEKNLNIAADEKKTLNDKINTFLLTEKKLTSEVSRLQDINKSLQKQLGDMEEKVMDVLGTNYKRPRAKHKQVNPTLGLPSSKAFSSENSSRYSKEERKLKIGDGCSNRCLTACSDMCLSDKVRMEENCHSYFHTLKERVGDIQFKSESNIDLIKKLNDKEREIMNLKEELCILKHEKMTAPKPCECNDNFRSGDSIKLILDRLEKERDVALTDISRLQGERDALREKVKLVTESHAKEYSRLEKIIEENEERIRRLECERRELISSQSCQRITLAKVEEKLDDCKEEARKTQSELALVTANYNQLKTLQEQTDRSLSEVQSRLDQADIDLRIAINKVKELESKKLELENEISTLRQEKCSLKSNLGLVEKEKDSLLISLDEKTEKIAKLEKEIKRQEAYISEMNEKMSFTERKFECLINEKANRDHELKTLERTVEHLKEELMKCERQREAFSRENRRLQDDLASAAKDCLTARRDLDDEKQEIENLKRQLQQYVSEVKRAEELLTKKETERNQLLDHFRSLSLEATALESNNHTLESKVENTKSQLTSANGRISELERQIDSKDNLLYSYEKQILEQTSRIADLEGKLQQQTELKIQAEQDLSALRDLCSVLDNQKETFRSQANNHDAEKIKLINEVRRLSEEFEGLNEKLSHEKNHSKTLEKSLSNSRQETLEHKITNKDLQGQVQYLRQKVNELTQKLESESLDVRMYQNQCADLSQQVSELRREMTNFRFEQARAAEDSRRNSPRSALERSRNGISSEEKVESRKKSEEISERNVPPLAFTEDTFRTVSLDSDEYPHKFLFENIESKFEWKLFPLAENSEKIGNNNRCPLDTVSELSSLPDDSEMRNICCTPVEELVTSRNPTGRTFCKSEQFSFSERTKTLDDEYFRESGHGVDKFSELENSLKNSDENSGKSDGFVTNPYAETELCGKFDINFSENYHKISTLEEVSETEATSASEKEKKKSSESQIDQKTFSI